MTSAFAIGCGVAGAAYALKGVLHVGSKLAQNPEAMKQAAALGAGLRGAGSVFKVPSFLSFTKHAGGFDAVMNRREAALILNCRRVLPAPLASVRARASARARPSTPAASLRVPPTPCTCTSRRVRVQEQVHRWLGLHLHPSPPADSVHLHLHLHLHRRLDQRLPGDRRLPGGLPARRSVVTSLATARRWVRRWCPPW